MRVDLSMTICWISYHFSEADARIPIKQKKAICKPPNAAILETTFVVSD